MTLADYIEFMRLLDDKTVVNGVPLGQLKQACNVLRLPMLFGTLKKTVSKSKQNRGAFDEK